MEMISNRNQIQKLKEYFEKRSDVVMAFVFGSQVGEKMRTMSDWDIAVYFTPEKNRVEWEDQNKEYPTEDDVWNDCIEILKTDNVDLVVLNRAPISIANSAIKGNPLVIKDYRLWLEFMLIASREAENYKEFVDDYFEISRRSVSISRQDEECLKKTLSFLEEQIALHEYFDIKWKRIADFIKNSESYFGAFIKNTQDYIERNKNYN